MIHKDSNNKKHQQFNHPTAPKWHHKFNPDKHNILKHSQQCKPLGKQVYHYQRQESTKTHHSIKKSKWVTTTPNSEPKHKQQQKQ